VDRYANRVLRKCYSNAKTRFQSFFMLIPPSLTQGRGNAAGVLSTVGNITRAGVENAATTIKPPAAAANKSLIIPTQIP
jgi:hypothetical protein